ncbi:MAG TPA: methyltransferase domain-containing protein, partial [Solirubrobacteraceae bacterium]|nr:methyltransferase domain-containing protein [Solirubrobacteraceae bacterium]
FLALERIMPGGSLISSDGVAAMVELARERAREQGVQNVEFKQLQLEWVDQATASVDAVLIKWAVMLLVDPSAALRECRRVLKPAGRLSLAVWDTAERNPWSSLPHRAMQELGYSEPPAPGPGMFALSAPGQLQGLLEDAGFMDIEVEPIGFQRAYPNLNAWIGEMIDLSRGFKTAWSQLDDGQRQLLRERLSELTAAFTGADGSLILGARSLGAAASA